MCYQLMLFHIFVLSNNVPIRSACWKHASLLTPHETNDVSAVWGAAITRKASVPKARNYSSRKKIPLINIDSVLLKERTILFFK